MITPNNALHDFFILMLIRIVYGLVDVPFVAENKTKKVRSKRNSEYAGLIPLQSDQKRRSDLQIQRTL